VALSLDEALGMSLADEADENIHVDVNTRQITIPESQQLFGVESDEDVEVKHIVIDGRYNDGTDLSTFTFRVNYQNANGDKDTYLATELQVNDSSIEFDWVIGRKVVAYKGTIAFIVCAYTIDSSSVIQNEWNSTLGKGTVLEGLEVSEFDFGDDIVRQLASILSDVNKAQASAKASADEAYKSKTEVVALGKEQQAAIEKKGKDTLATIPEDYTKVSNDVSQLKEDLADYEDVLDIKLYKASLAENAPGIGPNWNLYYDVSIPAGTKVIVTLNSYSGALFVNMSVRFFDANGNMKNYGSIKSIGGTMVITTTDDYTRLWLQINRSAIENGVNASVTFATNRSGVFKALTDLENTLNKKINEEILKASIIHTFHVEKDGTGDFTKLIDAIDEAEKYMNSVVYVGDGEWDIIDELGSDYVNSVSFNQRGIVLKNRIKIVFSSKSKVICDYSGDNTTIMNWLSPFNAGEHGFILENLNIYSHNVRYSMHDERDSDDDFYINRYINCHFFNYNENGGFRQCIGGGLGKNGYIVIENCIFENPKASNNSLVSYHNTANVGGGSAKSNIEVSNCYVKGTGTLRFSWYGTSTDTTIVKATGNNLGSAIQFVAETSDGTSPNENVELYEWNNIIRSD
jgi:hypothetical protein